MIRLENDILLQLQMNELEMLLEVDRICRKHAIRYSLDGGTLLGAVRHKGFIPWDDDADVAMLRSEYDKFFQVCGEELDTERFFLQDHRTDRKYRWGYSKLRRKGTLFLREGQEHVACDSGVFIDIFVFDNVPDGYAVRRLHLFFCYCARKMLYSEVGRKNEKSAILRLWYGALSLIPRDAVFAALHRVARLCNRKKTELIRHMTFPYARCRYGHTRSIFEEYGELEFEGHRFMAFKKHDLYLTEHFGDYMKLPPEGERKCHPVSGIRLVENELYLKKKSPDAPAFKLSE